MNRRSRLPLCVGWLFCALVLSGPVAGHDAGADAGTPAALPGPQSPAPPMEAGRAWAAALVGRLSGMLRDALAQGGPEHAVELCKLQAPAVTSAVAADAPEHDGWRVTGLGRTALRLRNPDNAPPAAIRDAVADLIGHHRPGQPPAEQLVRAGDSEIYYLRGIPTEPPCLACHGSSLPPSLAEAIRARYPQDEATGFAVGELRGVFWVRWQRSVPAADHRGSGGAG